MQPLWKTGSYPLKFNTCLSYDPETRAHPQGKKYLCPPKELFENVHNSFVVIAPSWKQLKCPAAGNRYAGGGTRTERHGCLTTAARNKWENFRDIVPSGVSRMQRSENRKNQSVVEGVRTMVSIGRF